MIGWFRRTLQWWYALTTPVQMPAKTTSEREKLRKSQLLSIMVLWSIILSSPIVLKNLHYGVTSPNLWNAVLFDALMLFTIYLNRRGSLEIGGYVYLFSYISQITWGMLVVQRSDGVGIFWGWAHYAIVPILAGLLLPFWSPILFGVMNYAIIVGIFAFDSQKGYFTVSLRHTGASNFLIHVAIAMMASSVAGMFYSYSQAQAISQADRAAELEQAHTELSAAHAKLEHLATIDPITGLLNHRALNTQLAQEITRSLRTGEPLSLIFGDIDHFKEVNDTWGHQTGDDVLAHVAGMLRAGCRESDCVARYGGEEFVMVLRGQHHDAARQSAERVRADIAASAILSGEHCITVTMSLGVASFPDHATAADTLLTRADAAMYCAKRSGRNRVCSPTDVPEQQAA